MSAKSQKVGRGALRPPRSSQRDDPTNAGVLMHFRAYQEPVFWDDTSGVLILHWSRQIGKSYVLAAWAVKRVMRNPGRLVTVLSNSKDNGAEFAKNVEEVCLLFKVAFQQLDDSADEQFENMRFETRITVGDKTGRIKVLAANPRTARGFSGDLILDEFAFHENSQAIWEAAEPIISSNPDFLCRISSTGNGKHNMFYRMTEGARAQIGSSRCDDRGMDALPLVGSSRCDDRSAQRSDPTNGQDRSAQRSDPTNGQDRSAQRSDPTNGICVSSLGFKVSRVPRTLAYALGVKIYDAITRQPITPDLARALALDKRAYDQNYECAFNDENMTLLTHELISAAERENVGVICEQDWTPAALALMRQAMGDIYAGIDVGRNRDLTVMTVIEKLNGLHLVRGILRIQGMRLPQQQLRLGEICRLPKFRRACIDMTGLGLGLTEYAQDAFGQWRIVGINFSSTVPLTDKLKLEGRKQETVRVTEAMATELLGIYEDRRIQHPADGELRDDLRKPEKIVSPGGRVSIAATRDEAGHADHFWSFALGVEAASSGGGEFAWAKLPQTRRNNLRMPLRMEVLI